MRAVRSLWRIVAVLLTIGVVGIVGWRFAIGWHPPRERYPVQGIDVGAGNGAVDWAVVAGQGVDFAYAVATRGAESRDPRFQDHWQAIETAGLRRGAIHIYSLCRLATDQANAFNTVVPRDLTALPAAIDVDYAADCTARPDRAVLLRELATMATMVETHMEKPVLLRIGRNIERDYRLSADLARSIWAIGNVFPPSYAARPWRMWRASDFRRVEGIEGPVNWNVAAS